MNHRNLGRGAIACSALVVAQWIPSFGAQLPGSICQNETEPEPASPAADSEKATVSQNCSINGMLSLMESLPEQFKLQWSQGRSAQLPLSIERKYQQLVEQAQTLANQNQVAEAIVLMNAIPKNSRYFDLAYQMQETWSQDILHLATSRYQQADLSAALKLLEAVPATSSQSPQITRLKRKWQQDAVQMQQAIAASKSGAWQDVIQQLEAFKGTPLFQSLPVQELLQLAMIKVLEPDPALMQVASTMNTSLSAAPLPSTPSDPISSSSLASPSPSFPTSSSKFDFQQVLAPSASSPMSAKPAKPERQAAISESAPSSPDGTTTSAGRSVSLPSMISAVHRFRTMVAEPEVVWQK